MIKKLTLIRNVGPFDSANGGSGLDLSRLTLIYAENGRGKTMLAAILRSLATGQRVLIDERHRLGTQNTPHIVIELAGQPSPIVFQNGSWNRTVPNIAIFDDEFVNQNVFSGLSVDADHRQNLHELILGSQGVTLNQQLQQHVNRIEEHNRALRTKSNAIPVDARGSISVDDFCNLRQESEIDSKIQDSERVLRSFEEKESVRTHPILPLVALPDINHRAIERVIERDLQSLDENTVKRVKAHLASIGGKGESWIGEGMEMVLADERCPFCAQGLDSSPLFSHYRAYFSKEYRDLKDNIQTTQNDFTLRHSGESIAEFERSVRRLVEGFQFWQEFCDIPQMTLDTDAIVKDWKLANEEVDKILKAKREAPLDSIELTSKTRSLIARFKMHIRKVKSLNRRIAETNKAIEEIKERRPVGDLQTLKDILNKLKATKARHSSEIAPLCKDYISEKNNKAQTEQQRDQARKDLDAYRTGIFPRYEGRVNHYLQVFNAGYQIRSMRAQGIGTGSGSVCNYQFVINNVNVPIAGGRHVAGKPSFRTTLSAGDRNTLALVYFFASLDFDNNLGEKVIVIDDPINSLDEHRSLSTVQEIRDLATRADQIILLSHNRPFLCSIWERADSNARTALMLQRANCASVLTQWDVSRDCITEHDKRHDLIKRYIGVQDNSIERQVATALRQHLEAFLRVGYPDYFHPGTLLGPFLSRCRQSLGTGTEILKTADFEELGKIAEYANRFHHDTNPAWETETINDTELLGFARRTLEFVKRPI